MHTYITNSTLIIGILLSFVNPSTADLSYEENTMYRNRGIKKDPDTTGSKIYCARACSHMEKCISFFHDSNAGSCFLSRKLHKISKTVEKLGWRYYELYSYVNLP